MKVTVRFFNIDDGVIHTTDKTEIEIDDEVIIYVTVLSLLEMHSGGNVRRP